MSYRSKVLAVLGLCTALLFSGSVASPPAAAASATCLNLGTSSIGFGDVTDDDWDAWTATTLDFASKEEFLQVRNVSGNMVLRQRLVPSRKGSERVTVKGDLPAASTYRMTQRVLFEPGFDWGRDKQGGKLGFGLGGGTSPTGGDIDPNGFSARFMWRGNGDGTARIVVYSYASDRDQNLPFGDDYQLSGFTAPIGRWFSLTMEVTANSAPGVADGSIRAWADGQLALEQNGIAWQNRGTPRVDRFIYSTFYGGNGWEWAPERTTYVAFDDVCWEPSNFEPEPEPGPTGPADPPSGSLVGEVAETRSDLEQLLPTGSGQVDWRINYALDQLSEASDSGEWRSANELRPESGSLRDIQRAIAKLESAASSSGASGAVRSGALGAANELAAVSVSLANNAVAEAERAIDQSECSCSSARRQLTRAKNEQQAMRAAGSSAEIASFARRSWSRAQLALGATP